MKLAAHVLGGSADALNFSAQAHASAVELVNAYSLASDFRRVRPNMLIIARPLLVNQYLPQHHDDTWRLFVGNPAAYYFAFIHGHQSHSANREINAWTTGLNEDTRKLPSGETPDFADWTRRAEFESNVGQLIRSHGAAPIYGNPAVGNPSGTRDEQLRAWRAYLPALRAAQQQRGYVALHVYFSISGWEGQLDSLIQTLTENGIDDVPILITETGVEPGYRREGGPASADYAASAIAFDRVLHLPQYRRVVAAFIFSFGDGSSEAWRPYNVDGDREFLDALIAYARAQSPPPPSLRTITNQGVLNIVNRVKSGLIGQMPHDLLDAMVADRSGPYTGPDPATWGIAEHDRAEIARRLAAARQPSEPT